MSDAATPKPKRLWFRFHLSTAVLLMIVASVLLWANMRSYSEEVWTEGSESREVTIDDAMAIETRLANDGSGRIGRYVRKRFYGWPFEALEVWETVEFRDHFWLAIDDKLNQQPFHRWNIKNVLWNLLIDIGSTLAALAAVVSGSEWRIRRREDRKS